MNIDDYLDIIKILETDLINPSKKDLIKILNENKDIDGFSYYIKKDIEIDKEINIYNFDLHFADVIINIESNTEIKFIIDNKILDSNQTIPIISLKNNNMEFKATMNDDGIINISIFAIKFNKVSMNEFNYYNKRMITNNDGLKIVNGNLK